ncbi:MAG: hypothetical protein K2Y71_17490 [Xanthobacteraceae bacterium]|nr:hypothetical protein [Xanthobacteraceae bacterium]
MPAEPTALSTVPPSEPPADADYDAICAAVTATARGRWFLDEFAKRNRNSDTSQVLAAIASMQAAVVGERVQQANRDAHQEVRIELLEMARTIAQARAAAAESRPLPSQAGAAEPAGAVTPDVAAAAERLRQIAWTMRACGIELPASDQVAQIAETILSADALRGLGEQRAQKLTEALTHLERRIDRMLDGHRTARVAAAEPAADAPPPPHRDEHGAPLATAAVAMIANAMRADAAAAAETATAIPERTAPTASDIAEYPMDDDVVLTVADSTGAPAAAAALAAEPDSLAVDPAPAADAEPVVRPDARAVAPQDERVELEIEPLVPAKPPAEDGADAEFAGLQLEPLAIAPAVADEPPSQPQPAALEETAVSVAEEKPDDPPPSATVADVAADLPVDPLLPATAIARPEAEPVTPASDANRDLPLTYAADEAAVAEPQAIEPKVTQASAIALQVDQDLDGLSDDGPDHGLDDAAAQSPVTPAAPARPQLVHAAEREEEPAEFLLEKAPRNVPVSALVASAQASRAQLSDTLAAIESELFGSTRPPADAPPGPAEGAIPAKPARAAAQGPLGALMAMSEEERIALFS